MNEHPELTQQLLTSPIQFDSSDIAGLFNLSSPRPCIPDGARFYVRTWQLTVDRLTSILHLWRKNDQHYAEGYFWRLAMEKMQDHDLVTLRYIGFVSGTGRSANDSHDEDLRRSGPMYALERGYSQLHNETPEPILHHFVDTSVFGTPNKDRQLRVDAREISLIARFGFDCRLIDR